MDNLEIGAVVVGLTGVAKELGVASSRLPLLAIIIGAFLSMGIAQSKGEPLVSGLLSGIMIGATATGLIKTSGSLIAKAK